MSTASARSGTTSTKSCLMSTKTGTAGTMNGIASTTSVNIGAANLGVVVQVVGIKTTYATSS